MLEFLEHIDQQIFLFLNGMHNSFFDVFFWWFSNKYFWFPFYALLIYILIKRDKQKGAFAVLALIILITLSDQGSVYLFKNLFQRYRPCHNVDLQGLVHIVNNKCGGTYGFISSHASNSFALALFTILYFKQNVYMDNIDLGNLNGLQQDLFRCTLSSRCFCWWNFWRNTGVF